MSSGAPSAPAGRAARPGTTGATGTTGAARRTGRPWLLRAAGAVRRHWLVSMLLAAGLVLRVLALAAYHPALIYVDTLKYLYGASPGSEPLGYTVLLRLMLLAGDLGTVVVVQHLLGLAMAVVLYVVLLRRGAARWLAALAVAPVLLDAYQIQMEQTIMPDVWFEVLIVAGLAVLLWRPAVTMPFAVAAGLILGSSATVKQLGELLVLPAVVYLLVGGGRRAVTSSAALVAAFLLPIVGYGGVSYARTGSPASGGWRRRRTAPRCGCPPRPGRCARPRPSRRWVPTGWSIPLSRRCTRRPSRTASGAG
jgi:hypothetical protein